MRLRRRALLLVALFISVLMVTGVVFDGRWRYVPPVTIGFLTRPTSSVRAFEHISGVSLPRGSRVLLITDGEPHDGTTGFSHWVIYSGKRITLPPVNERIQLYPPNLAENVRTVEKFISPFRIESPENSTYHTWEHAGREFRVDLIAGERGYYMSASVFEQE